MGYGTNANKRQRQKSVGGETGIDTFEGGVKKAVEKEGGVIHKKRARKEQAGNIVTGNEGEKRSNSTKKPRGEKESPVGCTVWKMAFQLVVPLKEG